MAKRKTRNGRVLAAGMAIGALGLGLIWLAIMVVSQRPNVQPPAKTAVELPPAPRPVVKPPKSPLLGEEPAWRRNAVRTTLIAGRPMIAIVLDDMGLDELRSAAALTLPGPLTLSYMTYAKDLPAQAAAAVARGDELMLHIPMQPQGAADPGPNALTVDLPDQILAERLQWDLSRLGGIVGVNNHMGSRFTEWDHGMNLVVDALEARGLFLLDSRTTAKTVGAAIARRRGLPYAERQVFLDDEQAAPAIGAMLARTEAIAQKQGAAIAIGHPHDATIAALRVWLPLVVQRGFQLVPVSAIVARNLDDSQRAIPVSN